MAAPATAPAASSLLPAALEIVVGELEEEEAALVVVVVGVNVDVVVAASIEETIEETIELFAEVVASGKEPIDEGAAAEAALEDDVEF
jgi:hypothetical protein